MSLTSSPHSIPALPFLANAQQAEQSWTGRTGHVQQHLAEAARRPPRPGRLHLRTQSHGGRCPCHAEGDGFSTASKLSYENMTGVPPALPPLGTLIVFAVTILSYWRTSCPAPTARPITLLWAASRPCFAWCCCSCYSPSRHAVSPGAPPTEKPGDMWKKPLAHCLRVEQVSSDSRPQMPL